MLNVRLSGCWDQIINEFKTLPSNKNIWSIVRRLVCGAADIWQERNNRLFKNEKRDSNTILNIVKETVSMKLIGIKVLDRINCLVEQPGSKTVNKCGTVEGKPMVLRPHPEFRILFYINLELCSDSSLCLHEGWATTLMVRDFVWYLVETSVRQNFMYLEYLGAQVASQLSRVALGSCTMELVQCQSDSTRAYETDLGMLHDMVSPKADGAGPNTMNQTWFDVALKYKKFFFAAN
ncbi:hypothetical protein Tco_0678475 [Tanacetum coccineum]|uniref:Uncharacterized protein n=1 Tax=Tanacetum coccineum TaxID=301880 RepID=A0ABQ4XF60_9ASTR